MKRNLKALGLALVAAFAMSVVAASAAQAEEPANFTQKQGTYPVAITGHEEEGTENYFQITGEGGPKTECDDVTYEGTISEETNAITVTPHYTECQAISSIGTVNASVDLNGCHYEFFAGTKNAGGSEGSAKIVCPPNEQIEVTTSLCDTDVPPQTIGAGITYKNDGGDVTVEVNVDETLTYEETETSIFGPCDDVHRSDGSFVSSVLVTGFVDEGTHHWITTDPDGGETTLETLTEGNPLDIDVG